MTHVKVASATKNPAKNKAFLKAFQEYFSNVELIPLAVNSGVPSQPINEDVYRGAENRLEAIKNMCKDADYFVSCEGGLINQYGYWFNVQVIMIEGKDGKRGSSISQGFQIPTQYVEEVINTSIAQVFDRVFQGEGGVRRLTGGKFTREDLVRDGTIMALTRMLNGENW